MNKMRHTEKLKLFSRVYWCWGVPNAILLLALIVIGSILYFKLEARTSTPTSTYEGLYIIPAVVSVVVLTCVSSALSLVLAFIPWRRRGIAFVTGLMFLFLVNATGVIGLVFWAKSL